MIVAKVEKANVILEESQNNNCLTSFGCQLDIVKSNMFEGISNVMALLGGRFH